MQLDASLVGVSSSQQTGELYKALVKAQRGYKPIKRSGLNQAEGFRYATFADICEGTVPSLLEAGLAQPTFSMGFDKTIGRWVLIGTLCHAESDQWVSAVCPLMIGFPEGSRPGIQDLEIDNTYAKKILMGNLVGGWLESEVGGDPEQKPEPVVAVQPAKKEPEAPAKITPVKQPSKRGKPAPMSDDGKALIARADAKLGSLPKDDPQRAVIFEHLDGMVKDGIVTSSAVLELKAKHTFSARKVKEVSSAE